MCLLVGLVGCFVLIDLMIVCLFSWLFGWLVVEYFLLMVIHKIIPLTYLRDFD